MGLRGGPDQGTRRRRRGNVVDGLRRSEACSSSATIVERILQGQVQEQGSLERQRTFRQVGKTRPDVQGRKRKGQTAACTRGQRREASGKRDDPTEQSPDLRKGQVLQLWTTRSLGVRAPQRRPRRTYPQQRVGQALGERQDGCDRSERDHLLLR